MPAGQPATALHAPVQLCCPLAKTPLRYAQESAEWVNDELGIAYPTQQGIAILIPRKARMLSSNGVHR